MDDIIVVIKQYNHNREVNHITLIINLREIIKLRASAENTLLKNIYDEEARRYISA